VLASEFINRGKIIRVIRYTDPEGKTAYYHPDGRSVRKMFLRCPLPFMRVTSSYGYRRHPVLGFSARHNGVDFAAPVGTKIRASASGVIQRTGYDRGRGRYILIRHPNRYISHYYHLSRMAKGTRSGVKVEQGQVIGYVGSTGLATGPHLHYGLRKNGRFLNPLRLKSPTKNPVKKKYMEAFQRFMAGHFLVISGSRLMKLPKGVQDFLLTPTPSGSPTPSTSSVVTLDP
jgi:murein DD-endopeptidase MepM/ murein hydrolase activator NlpD